MEERLQKIIAQAGCCSRRKAEELILAGRVEVNGEKITELGRKFDAASAEVRIDGEPLKAKEEHVYFLLNKPKGYVSTASDERGRRTVLSLIKECAARIYPVGRLDMNTEGLLLLTNDGALMNGLLHPRYEVEKVYRARVRGELSPRELGRLEAGVELEDGVTAPAKVRVLESTPEESRLELTIHEGRNREVRRMLAAVGHEMLALKRVAFASLSLKGVSRGRYRALTAEEIEMLYRTAGLK